MTTSAVLSEFPRAATRLPQRVRHALRFRRLRVLGREMLGPHMLRLWLGGEELDGFHSPGFDDHVKLILPDPGNGSLTLPEVTAEGVVWPAQRPLMRDYTPREHDADWGRLAIDFALHEAGPATAWAMAAKPGDVVGVGGPRGSMLVPVDYDWHLLIGDDTAVPAIARRLAELPAGGRAIVVIEVDGPEDELPLRSAADLQVQWLHRRGAAAGLRPLLREAVAALQLPPGDGHVWVGCESAQARELRAHLVGERGLSGRQVKAAAYWRRGAAGVHEPLDD